PAEMENSDMDFIIAATEKNIMMVEGESKECQEEDLILAIETAHAAIRRQVQAQEELRTKVGAPAKREVAPFEENEDIKVKVAAFAGARLLEIARAGSAKHVRSAALKTLKDELIAS